MKERIDYVYPSADALSRYTEAKHNSALNFKAALESRNQNFQKGYDLASNASIVSGRQARSIAKNNFGGKTTTTSFAVPLEQSFFNRRNASDN